MKTETIGIPDAPATPEHVKKLVQSMRRLFTGGIPRYTDEEVHLLVLGWKAESEKMEVLLTAQCELIAEAHAEVKQLQEQNTYLDKVSSELQDLCDRQAKMLGERDAVLKQALVALEHVKPMVGSYWGGTSHDEAISAIKGVLNV